MTLHLLSSSIVIKGGYTIRHVNAESSHNVAFSRVGVWVGIPDMSAENRWLLCGNTDPPSIWAQRRLAEGRLYCLSMRRYYNENLWATSNARLSGLGLTMRPTGSRPTAWL